MGHQRRYYRHGDVCLVTNRLAEGLPFVPNTYINSIIYGAVARAAGLNPGIVLCAFEFLPNHYHFVVYIKGDAEDMARFLHDIDDELARIVRKLLGTTHKKFWAQRPHVAALGDAQAVIQEMAYCFLNAVEPNFCERAADWTGVNSFRFLFSSKEERCKWVPTRRLRPLPNRSFSEKEIKRLQLRWEDAPGKAFTLKVSPFAWKRCFSKTSALSDRELLELLLVRIEAGEKRCRARRMQAKQNVANLSLLALQNPHKPYKPKKQGGRRVYCICTDDEVRKEMIAAYKSFCETCAAVWAAWKKGDFSAKYPPGAFLPPRAPLCNVFVPSP